jgi:hypothetical protein
MCSLYRGPLLLGFDPSFNPTVDSMLPLDGTKLSYTEAHDDSWLPANCLYEFTAVDGQQTKVRLADYGSLGLRGHVSPVDNSASNMRPLAFSVSSRLWFPYVCGSVGYPAHGVRRVLQRGLQSNSQSRDRLRRSLKQTRRGLFLPTTCSQSPRLQLLSRSPPRNTCTRKKWQSSFSQATTVSLEGALGSPWTAHTRQSGLRPSHGLIV